MSAHSQDVRMTRLEGAVEHVNQTLDRIDLRLDSIFALLDQKFNWLIGIVLGTWIVTMLTILFHH
ncbi:MAG: hypothetical protein JO349_09610 [Candidatus Eremiobacteraeota bacterium]|nr:hypothetical protein [Candidatus Eremiobacteraeota bacterium]